MSTVRQNEKRHIRVPNKLVDSDYGIVIAKNRRNKNKKDAKANDGIDVVLVSQNDDFVEMMNENQTRVTLEEDKVEKDLNDVEKGIGKVDMIDMVNKGMSAERIQNDEVQKENDEGYKFSYAKMVNNSNLNNKLSLIPTEVNDNGIEVVIFDEEIVNEGSKKWELTKWDSSVSLDKAEPSALPLWVKLKNLPLEAWSSKGISVVASRLGTPIIMDQTTTNMCNLGNGRPGFARVLHWKKGGRKMNVTENHKKETIRNKSKNVVYRPVKKSNLVAEEGTKHSNSQKKDRNMNSFKILSEYDDMEGIKKELQCEDKVSEEDDVFEGSGMANNMKVNEVCSILESHLKNKKIYKACDKAFGNWNWISNINLLADLSRHKQISTGKPWMIRGDMNVILNTNEHSAGASFVSSEMQEFKDYVNMIEVEDLCSFGLFFTWTKNLKKDKAGDETMILKKLDRVMKKKKAFKFANFVAHKDDFKTIVEKEWRTKVGGLQMFQLVKKLRNLKVHLKKLAWQNGNLFEKVEKIIDNLKNIQRDIDKDPYNKALRKEEVAILKEYMTAMEDEEKILFQKSKIKWLSLGDINNSFFHKTLKGRYQKSRIEKIQDVNGNSFESQEVANQFVMHFKKFMGSSQKVEGIGECHSLFKNKVNENEALSLIEDVSSKEIKDALFDIGDKKAPRPDGFLFVFFKKAWNIIGEDFCKAFKEFFKYGKMLKDLNSNVISLIPKTQSPLKVTDYRPIACCNVVYKCISKVITGRLKRVLGNLWIIVCVKTTSFTINVNGELCRFFKGGRDDLLVLCHGDAESVKVTVIKEINSLLMGFQWCNGELLRGKAKIAWKKICKPKSYGGLGSPLCRIISNRSIYSAGLSRDMMVADIVVDGNWTWPTEWLNEFSILRQIKTLDLNTKKKYLLVWKNKDEKECKFSTKKVYKDMRNQSSEITWTKLVWFSQCIPKQSFILWMAIQGKLMTWDRITKWGSYDMNVCTLCKENDESHDHLFFKCNFSQTILRKLKPLMQFKSNADKWNNIIEELAKNPNNNSIWSTVRRLCLAGAVYLFGEKETTGYLEMNNIAGKSP
nr:hypothetical protein [Tanacetum cinerariifolium]